MSEVQTRDILLRVGGRTLQRFGVLACNGAGRAIPEVVETETRADGTTCATLIDPDLLVRTAAAGKVRIEYTPALAGIADQFGYPYCGPSLDGSRADAFTKAEKFDDAVWVKEGTSTVTADATAAPNGATTADKIVEAAAGAGSVNHGFNRATPALTDSTKQPFSIFAKASSRTWIQVASINKASAIGRTYVNLATGAIGTTLNHTNTVVALANGWYRISISFDAATGAGTPKVFVRAATGDNVDQYVGDGASGVFVWGADFETDKVFPSSYIATDASAVTRAADSLVVPVNFGTNIADISMLWRLARPVHADSVGALGVNPGIYDLGDAGTNHMWGYFDAAARNLFFAIESGGSVSTSPAVPAGTELIFAVNYTRDPATGKWKVRADVTGGGYGAYSGLTPAALAALSTQNLRVGGIQGSTSNNLFGVLFDGIVTRGNFTRAELLAIP